MTILVTTVGISIFENYRLGGKKTKNITVKYRDFLKKSNSFSNHNEEELQDLECIKNVILEHPEFPNIDFNLSAEISSIRRIIEKSSENAFTIYLVTTDTLLSVGAALLIKKWFEQEVINEKLDKIVEAKFKLPEDKFFDQKDSRHIIKNLNVNNQKDYQNGFINLFDVLNQIKEENHERKEIQGLKKEDAIALNITGGYKVIAPIMALYGQLERLDVQYIYDERVLDKDKVEVISLGNFPVNFDWDIVEALLEYLNQDKLNQLVDNTEKEPLKSLIDHKLCIKKEGRITFTVAATLLKRYAEYNSSMRRGLLGTYLEYQLYHYFSRKDIDEQYSNPTKSEIIYYYNPETKLPKEGSGGSGYYELGDIDLALETNTGEEVICEIKAVSNLKRHYKKNKGKAKDYYDRQIKPRIISQKQPAEFHLYVYHISYQQIKDKHKWIKDDALQEVIQYYTNRMKSDKETQNTIFRVRGFSVDLSKKGLNINYAKLLREPFKKEGWIDIYNGNLPSAPIT